VAKIIVLMGAPGVGKGTQAKLLSQQFGWPPISTGEILREIAQTDTELGRHVKQVQAAGLLVSDEILAEIIQERTARPDCQQGYILDGFPRTIHQAHLLDRLALNQGHTIVAMNLSVDRKALIKRLLGRRQCPACGRLYNIYLWPPAQDGLCDVCHTPLMTRSDDTPEAVEQRLNVYEEKSTPLIEYYRRAGYLRDIDAGRSVEDVLHEIRRILETSRHDHAAHESGN
jgi:adenylate kinase